MTDVEGEVAVERRPPKITVYIPSFNYGRFLEKSIESVIAQTTDDWELIVIDDGSTDNTREILERYASHPKIRVVLQENRGLNATCNRALDLARGQYFTRLDSDDWADENWLLVLSTALDRNPDAGLVYSDYYLVDIDGDVYDCIRRPRIGAEIELLEQAAHGACTMVRTDVLREVGGYSAGFACQDGFDLWLKITAKRRPINVNVPLFYYRQHGSSLSKREMLILQTRARILAHHARERAPGAFKAVGLIGVNGPPRNQFCHPLRQLLGKSLLERTIETALETRSLHGVIVVADDQAVLDEAARFPGIIPIFWKGTKDGRARRGLEVARESLGLISEKLGYEPDAICALSIASPLRRAEHIDAAVDSMLLHKTDSVLSVRPATEPYFQYRRRGLVPLEETDRRLTREAKALFGFNGAVHLVRTETLRSGRQHGDIVGHVEMLASESLRVTDEYSFWIAERILQDWRPRVMPGLPRPEGAKAENALPPAPVPVSAPAAAVLEMGAGGAASSSAPGRRRAVSSVPPSSDDNIAPLSYDLREKALRQPAPTLTSEGVDPRATKGHGTNGHAVPVNGHVPAADGKERKHETSPPRAQAIAIHVADRFTPSPHAHTLATEEVPTQLAPINVVILPPLHDLRWAEDLQKALPGSTVQAFDHPDQAASALEEADAVYGFVPPNLLPRAKKLRWIHCYGTGPDPSFFYPELIASDVIVTNPRGIYDDHLATHALTMMLALARHIPGYVLQQASGGWRPIARALPMPGATVLVVGVGGVGQELARQCTTLGMRVLGVDARPVKSPNLEDVVPPEKLDDMLGQADFVVVCTPETPATRGLMHLARFKRMKPTAFLINVGRGANVVTEDLVEALEKKVIAGAGLDVVSPEPLPAEHPLRKMPDVLLTPHIGVFDAVGLMERRRDIFLENCRRFAQGLPLLNVVDKSLGS